MSEVIGRGIIEVSGDTSKLNAAIAEARKSLKTLGGTQKETSEAASRSIDNYIKRINVQNALHGRSAREMALYKLALKGASDEQLRAANSALKLGEAHARMEKLRRLGPAIGLSLAVGFVAAAVAADRLIGKAAEFQDLGEKMGDTGENVASLAMAAAGAGIEMETVASASVKLTKNLVGVDDESKAAGAALKALGINVKDFKGLKPADQIEAVAKAMDGFQDGAGKSAVAMALFGKSGADMIPFLKDLSEEGARQVILTQQQIDKADEYEKKMGQMRAQLSLNAQAIAVEMMPALADLTGAFGDFLGGLDDATDGSKKLGENTGIQDFADGAARSMAFVIDSVDGAIRVITILGKSVGAVVGAAIAVNKHEYKQAANIMRQLDDDIKSTLSRPTLGAKLDARIEARNKSQAAKRKGQSGQPAADPDKPALRYEGVTPKSKGGGASTIAKAAKERLAGDLAGIRAAGDEIADAYSNAEKIMEARRAAGLVNERQYFDAKLGFLRLNAQAQSDALNAEIKRLEAEKSVGEDRIANEQKIADAKAKLAKVQSDLVANTEVLTIQDAAAVDKLAKSYLEAASAAQAYIDTVKRQNQREIEGVGRGTKFRERQTERNDIEDKFTERRQSLEGDLRRNEISTADFEVYLDVARQTYAEEMRLFEERTRRIDQLQSDSFLGMTEALHNYADEARDIAGMTEQAFSNGLRGLEDELVNFATTGKGSFKDLVNSITQDIARIGIKSLLGKASDFILGKAEGDKGSPALSGGSAVQAHSIAANAGAAALDQLTAAAHSAASAVAGIRAPIAPQPSMPGATGSGAVPAISSELIGAQENAAGAADNFSQNALSAANDLTRMASAAGLGGDAMTRLPGIISLFQSAIMAMSASGGGSSGSGIGGLIGAFLSAYSGSSGGSAAGSSSMIASAFGGREYHTGGIVGASSGASRAISTYAIANATRYHTGGIAGLKADEVPAVLMGGPKGKREEVLTAEDPRHRDNLGMNALQMIARESKHEGLRPKGGRELGGPVSPSSLYRVNEKKRPELLEVAGKQYLMTGAQGGKVSDPGATQRGGDTHIKVEVAMPHGANRTTAQQFGANAAREMQRRLNRS